MKIKKILYIVIAAADLLSVIMWIVLTTSGNSLAKSQSYNYAAQKWSTDGEYSQISCFLSDDSGFTTDSVGGVKASIMTALKNISVMPEENKKFIPEAYSTPAGKTTIRSDTTSGRSEAQLTAVGGDFFMFRDFSLLDGAYFTDDDIMQDGAVIDRSLAWALYGSDDVAGMNIYINGIKFYIAGVIDNPETKQEKKTAGEIPHAYISYDGAELINAGAGLSDYMGTSSGMKNITCYECIVPDPVENYAYNAVDEYFKGSYNGSYTIVNNTERFSPSVRAKAFKNLSDYAVTENSVIYPYWENASRIAEFKLTSIYFYRRFTYIAPVITLLYLLVILWKAAGRLKHTATEWTGDKITRLIYNHNQKKNSKD